MNPALNWGTTNIVFPINHLIIMSQWLSSVSATPGVIMGIVDANGIVNPR